MTRLSGGNDESSFKHTKRECLQDILVRVSSRQTYRERTQEKNPGSCQDENTQQETKTVAPGVERVKWREKKKKQSAKECQH